MRRIFGAIVISSVISALVAAVGCATLRGKERGVAVEKVKPKVTMEAYPFSLAEVRLLEGPFKDAMESNRKYLQDLESDRLLHMFRVNAGLPSAAEPLGGWEEPQGELRGHFMGHYLSGCALTYASTGDEKLKAKADAIVAELAKCQKALGETGYLSAYPESFIDRVEAFQSVWAPYYTLHKIFAGLLDMYVYCGNQQALEVAEKMANWVKMRTDRLTEEHMQKMLDRTEQGGMNDTLCNLYAVTGKPEYLALARRFDQGSYVLPLSRHEDALKDQHANSFIPNIVGSAREYELTGDPVCRDISIFFWEQVTEGRAYATGGTSNHERWIGNPKFLADQLSQNTHESCCTYNMLKLTRQLFEWDPSVRYADYYERALYNGILSTINPEDGMTMYYVPMASGWYKTYSTPRGSFWCCTGTGVENHAKYGDSIYFHDEEGLIVNLFIACVLTWREKGITVRQETKFPEEEGTTLVIGAKKPVDLSFRVRVPYWATKGAEVRINGKVEQVAAQPASYLTLKRKWRDGDRVEVRLPMSLHLERMPDDPNVAAIMVGPIVLAGALGNEEVDAESTHGRLSAGGDAVHAPDLVADQENLTGWIKPVGDKPLAFRTVGAGHPKDVSLIPFHKTVGQRYAVYWNFFADVPSWQVYTERRDREEAVQKDRESRTVDGVWVGGRRSEGSHEFQGEKVERGEYQNRRWIQANDGGWFSYQLKVDAGLPMALLVTYWGADSGGREFDILVDDAKIAAQALNALSPGQFIGVEYKIPAELTTGKEKVTVKFAPHPGNVAGAVYGCGMLKAKD